MKIPYVNCGLVAARANIRIGDRGTTAGREPSVSACTHVADDGMNLSNDCVEIGGCEQAIFDDYLAVDSTPPPRR